MSAKPSHLRRITEKLHSGGLFFSTAFGKLMDVQTSDHISRVLDAYQAADGIVELPELEVRHASAHLRPD